jgi:hypothetical protein
MTAYIDIQTGEFPLFEGDIKLEHKNVSWGSPFVAPENYAPIELPVPPDLPWNKVFVYGAAELVDGKWRQAWSIRDVTDEEREDRLRAKWREIRAKRNSQLLACDWTQLQDAPLTASDRNAWTVYRQQLRDITEAQDPFLIEWPVAPS